MYSIVVLALIAAVAIGKKVKAPLEKFAKRTDLSTLVSKYSWLHGLELESPNVQAYPRQLSTCLEHIDNAKKVQAQSSSFSSWSCSDFASASLCSACSSCASSSTGFERYETGNDYSLGGSNCLCVEDNGGDSISMGSDDDCVIVLPGVEFSYGIQLSYGNDCIIEAGRLTDDESVRGGEGDDTYIVFSDAHEQFVKGYLGDTTGNDCYYIGGDVYTITDDSGDDVYYVDDKGGFNSLSDTATGGVNFAIIDGSHEFLKPTSTDGDQTEFGTVLTMDGTDVADIIRIRGAAHFGTITMGSGDNDLRLLGTSEQIIDSSIYGGDGEDYVSLGPGVHQIGNDGEIYLGGGDDTLVIHSGARVYSISLSTGNDKLYISDDVHLGGFGTSGTIRCGADTDKVYFKSSQTNFHTDRIKAHATFLQDCEFVETSTSWSSPSSSSSSSSSSS